MRPKSRSSSIPSTAPSSCLSLSTPFPPKYPKYHPVLEVHTSFLVLRSSWREGQMKTAGVSVCSGASLGRAPSPLADTGCQSHKSSHWQLETREGRSSLSQEPALTSWERPLVYSTLGLFQLLFCSNSIFSSRPFLSFKLRYNLHSAKFILIAYNSPAVTNTYIV